MKKAFNKTAIETLIFEREAQPVERRTVKCVDLNLRNIVGMIRKKIQRDGKLLGPTCEDQAHL